MKHLSRLRHIVLLWVGVMAIAGTQSLKAQFDEAPRNFWTIDFSVGAGFKNSPDIFATSRYSTEELRHAKGESSGCPLSITFGWDRRLFSNFYFGIHFGYKYNYEKASGDLYRWRSSYRYERWEKDKHIDANLNYHLLILPIEFGYNHSYSHKYGMGAYISIIPGYCMAASASGQIGSHDDVGINNPGFCLDSAIGLRYYIQHVYLGVSYHYGINAPQKQIDGMGVLGSVGYRF